MGQKGFSAGLPQSERRWRGFSVVVDVFWRALSPSQFGQNLARSRAHGWATSGYAQGVAAGLDREELF